MSELATILERESESVDLLPGGFERLLHRRDRRRRNERLATIVVALVLAAAALGGAIRILRTAGREVPADRIDRQTVPELSVIATGDVGGKSQGGIAASDGLVFVVSKGANELIALPATCGTSSGACEPTWVADTSEVAPTGGNFAFGAADGMVFVATDRLYAFSASCGTGGATCEPLWAGTVDGRPFDPALGPDAVYLLTNKAKLYSFPISCAATAGECEPNWVSVKLPDRFFHPVPTDDAVYVGRVVDGRYLAFPAVCSNPCQPSGSWEVPGPLRWSPPAVAGSVMFIETNDATGTDSVLWAYPTSCTTSDTCEPLWTTPLSETSWPYIADGRVVLSTFATTVTVFSVECQAPPCEPLWTAEGLPGGSFAAGSVSNGVLFVPQQEGGIFAFPIDCGTGNVTCEPIWSWGTGRAGDPKVRVNSLVALDDRVFAVSQDGELYVLGLGQETVEDEPGGSSPFFTVVAVVALVVAITFVTIRRRRV